MEPDDVDDGENTEDAEDMGGDKGKAIGLDRSETYAY
jgi:hypothetical protein